MRSIRQAYFSILPTRRRRRDIYTILRTTWVRRDKPQRPGSDLKQNNLTHRSRHTTSLHTESTLPARLFSMIPDLQFRTTHSCEHQKESKNLGDLETPELTEQKSYHPRWVRSQQSERIPNHGLRRVKAELPSRDVADSRARSLQESVEQHACQGLNG